MSAPVRRGDFEYFSRTIEGQQYDVHCRRPAGTPGAPRSRTRLRAPRRARPSCSTRTRSRRATTTSRSATSRSIPHQTLAAYTDRHDAAVSATTCASATLDDGRRPSRRRARRVLRRRLGERRPHRALHPPRRCDAAVAGVATHARHDRRRRRARVPGGRRPVLRVRRARPHRPRPADHVGVEGDHRGAAGRRRRRRRRRRASSSRACRVTSTTWSTTTAPPAAASSCSPTPTAPRTSR